MHFRIQVRTLEARTEPPNSNITNTGTVCMVLETDYILPYPIQYLPPLPFPCVPVPPTAKNHLQHSRHTQQRNNRRTPRHTQRRRRALKRAHNRRRRRPRRTSRDARRLARRGPHSRLGSSHTCDAGDARAGRGTQGLRGLAELGDLVLHGGLAERVRAVVVADEEVGVDVAHADVVVRFLVAGFDARGVAVDAGGEDAEKKNGRVSVGLGYGVRFGGVLRLGGYGHTSEPHTFPAQQPD